MHTDFPHCWFACCLLATFGKADSAEPCAVLTCLASLHTDYACSNDTLRAPCAVHQPQQIGQHSPQITYEDIMSLLASGASPTGVMMCVQCLGMLPSRRVLRPGRALTF